MSRKTVTIALFTCICVACSSCTYQAWFEGFKERQRQECLKHVGDDDIQQCLEEVNTMTYEEYKRTRPEPR